MAHPSLAIKKEPCSHSMCLCEWVEEEEEEEEEGLGISILLG